MRQAFELFLLAVGGIKTIMAIHDYLIEKVGRSSCDIAASHEAKYEYDPHLDPSLPWAGKVAGLCRLSVGSSVWLCSGLAVKGFL